MSHTKPLDYNTTDCKTLKISELKRMADYWFRYYLLSKVSRNGKGGIWCPIKEKHYPEDKMHVAHFRDRHHIESRYDEDNCHLISEESNLWDSKIPYGNYKSLHHYEYEVYLRKKIGHKKVEKLLHSTHNLSIFGRQYYIDVINEFRKTTSVH